MKTVQVEIITSNFTRGDWEITDQVVLGRYTSSDEIMLMCRDVYFPIWITRSQLSLVLFPDQKNS